MHPLNGHLNKFVQTIDCEVYHIISSVAKIAFVISVSKAWPEMSGSTKNVLKQAKEIL